MRRLVVLAVVLALALSLSVPAFAAESYVFEYWEPVFYSDFAFNGSGTYVMYGFLPAGRYDISFIIDGDEKYFCTQDVSYTSADIDGVSGDLWNASVPFAAGQGPGEVELFVFRGEVDGYKISMLGMEYNGLPINTYTLVRFTPVSSQSSTALSAFSGLSVVLGVVLDVILGNWFLSILLCLSLVGLGVVAFRKLRRSR